MIKISDMVGEDGKLKRRTADLALYSYHSGFSRGVTVPTVNVLRRPPGRSDQFEWPDISVEGRVQVGSAEGLLKYTYAYRQA